MRISLTIEGQEGVAWDQWRSSAEAVEAAGLEGLFRSDHYRSITRGEPAGSLDAWASLAALGAVTQRIRLGTMVSAVRFRPHRDPRQERGHGRPHLWWTGRAGHRRRLVRAGAHDVPAAVRDDA